MLKLNEYLDISKLADHLREGIVECRQHKTLPLLIYCYSKRATFETIWDEVTCKTRGLIVDADTLEIVARPFEKFFNFNTSFRPETQLATLAKENFKPYVQDKLDGSMGTYWQWKDHEGIATKGSFHSEQAEWATQWYAEHKARRLKEGHAMYWMYPWTPVFEIICQNIQHHVCHYEPTEDNTLKLIGMVNRQSGEELLGGVLEHQAKINGLECAEQMPTYRISGNYVLLKLLNTSERPGKEGFVVSFARSGKPSLKVKIKHEEFLRLQKIAHYTTPRVVFEYCALGNWDEINTVMRDASPFLAGQVKEWVTNYQNEYDRINSDARYWVTMAHLECTTRKEYAAYFHQPHITALSAVCFNILDEKEYKQAIWDLVEPIVKQQKFSEVEAEG